MAEEGRMFASYLNAEYRGLLGIAQAQIKHQAGTQGVFNGEEKSIRYPGGSHGSGELVR